MGNKQTHNSHSIPERSLSWQPDQSKGLPPRRNSFANQSNVPNGIGHPPMMPRGYAASETGTPRYQKRTSPTDNSSKFGNKVNQTMQEKRNNIMVPQRPYDSPFIRPGFMPPPYPPPPPMPIYGTMAPGPIGPMPFMYPPPPPFGPPMDPIYVNRSPSSNDSKRIKKLRQKQKVSRNESTLSTLTEMPPPHMYAIMPPPLPPPGLYGPAVYRTRSMDNVYINAKNMQRHKMIENGPENNAQMDIRTDSPETNKMNKNAIKHAKLSDRQKDATKKAATHQAIKVQTLSPMKDYLTTIDDNSKEIVGIKAVPSRYLNEPGNSSVASDSIYESVKGAKPAIKKGKNVRKNSQESPTAVNIHFDFAEKEKTDKFRPVVTMVSLDAQAIMERNAKRLADAEREEDQRPGMVVVNEDQKQIYEDENDINEKKVIYGYLPSRKVDDEVYQQRSLQRPAPVQSVQTLRKEVELLEMKFNEPKIIEPSPILSHSSCTTSSQTSSRRSSESKIVKNHDERGEIMIEAILNPVLNQQKSKKNEEFKSLNAWNEINVSSEMKKRLSGRNSGNHFQRPVDERIMVRLIPSPPPKQIHGQEPIYLDYDKKLPDFKKHLIETGSFDYPEADQQFHNSFTNSKDGISFKDQSNGGRLTSNYNQNQQNDDWINEENLKMNSKQNNSKRQRYSFDNRSKSNVETERGRLVSLTPSIAKIKAGDCSDIDFSWVDDLESRFRLEREQFEKELQNIQERTLQRGIKPLHPVDKTSYVNPPQEQHCAMKRSTSTEEPSTLLDSSSHHTNSTGEAANSTRFKMETNPKASYYFGDNDVQLSNSHSGSNYLRNYSVPNNDNGVSSLQDDIKRPDFNNYNRSKAAHFENGSRIQQGEIDKGQFETHQQHYQGKLPIEDEPIYIPKPDYEQMENASNFQNHSNPKVLQQDYGNGGIPHYSEWHGHHDYNPYFDRSLTVQTMHNHENTNRAYTSPSPRSPSQRKLNRYYNPNGTNPYNSDSEWIEAEPETCNRDRYNLQLSGSYAINPNITEEFTNFDSVDKSYFEEPKQIDVRQYNGSQPVRQQKFSEDNTRRFVEKMNEFSADENQKWSRNPARIQRSNYINSQITNGHGNGKDTNYTGMYVSRPGSGNAKYNFSRGSNGNNIYGSSHY